MSNFINNLFNAPDTSQQTAALNNQVAQTQQIASDNAASRDQQAIALTRQTQDLQTQAAEQNTSAGRSLRAPKGRRLLLAATGEQGVSSTLGGG